MAKGDLTAARLRELLSYDPVTGAFFRANGRLIQNKPTEAGYIRFNVGRYFRDYAHRMAVALMTGEFPPEGFEVDHINKDKADNSWENLRVVTVSVNQQNQIRCKSDNSTGLLGVTKDARTGKFVAQIWLDGRNRRLGRFPTADLAHQAYVAAKRQLHAGNTL